MEKVKYEELSESNIGKIKDVTINQCNQNTLFGEVIFNKNYKENAA